MALLLGAPLSACGESEQNEGRLLLDRIEALEGLPVPVRAALIEELSELPLRSEALLTTRDRCVDMHRALVLAEQNTAEARQIITAAEQGGDVPPAELRRVPGLLAGSDEAVEQARERRTECQRGLSSLRMRLGRRRGDSP
ncbi:MAG: hypothetical protein OEY14_01450 [Myxococcales bacterium]|nr:hypothetical protein [Myxococcales bacterium]